VVSARSVRAVDVIELLSLAPHPEGGHFRETWRDHPGSGGRGSGTAIYYLLGAGEVSRWHRVDATEIWHWYAGAPLRLDLIEPDGARHARLLGPDLASGARPQQIVRAHAWQSARSEGAWTLVGCTVSPAFEFSGFELAPPDWAPQP
jgi:predicted cupin superfamily sugar epimerase